MWTTAAVGARGVKNDSRIMAGAGQRQVTTLSPSFAFRHRCRPLAEALRWVSGPEPLVSALSVLSGTVFGVDGSREASISVQNGRIFPTNHPQVSHNECIQIMETPVQKASFSTRASAFFG
jgi:hypothetical protein